MIITQSEEKYYKFEFTIPDNVEEGTVDGDSFQTDCYASAQIAADSMNNWVDEQEHPEAYYKIIFTNKTHWLMWEVGKMIIRVFIPFGPFIPLP